MIILLWLKLATDSRKPHCEGNSLSGNEIPKSLEPGRREGVRNCASQRKPAAIILLSSSVNDYWRRSWKATMKILWYQSADRYH